MGLITIHLNNANPHDDNLDEVDPKTVIHVRLMASRNQCKQLKACKKDGGIGACQKIKKKK